jgi:hypothetical protein
MSKRTKSCCEACVDVSGRFLWSDDDCVQGCRDIGSVFQIEIKTQDWMGTPVPAGCTAFVVLHDVMLLS